ncbi:ATP-dependent DNA ligase [Candidatus Methanoliparum sp. LAM-1]|uniref:ATP-dependent DNA ligase n=1 Tax=Candidatus Methanoliparum sp. LAM-1 TaxID=2874846 RepID=UPI003B638BE5
MLLLDVLYRELVDTFEKIEKTSKRLEITDYLSNLFKKIPSDIIDKVVYLIKGGLHPDYLGIELGIAEKLTIKSISAATSIPEEDILKKWQEIGDLGTVTEILISNQTKEEESKKNSYSIKKPLTIEAVYMVLGHIAKLSGTGSQKAKIQILSYLLQYAEPVEAKYIIKTVTGKLRLGVGDMLIIDALSIAFAKKTDRNVIERAYNIYPDLGMIAKVLAKEGLDGVLSIKITPGIPIRPMLAERLYNIKEILEKIPLSAVENKYDGIRMQCHIKDDIIKLFSRRLEDITDQFPDIRMDLKESKIRDAIFEGECVAFNQNTGEILPFQEISHRRGRKQGIIQAIEDYPVCLFLFDCLYKDGEDLTVKSYLERRKILESVIKPFDKIDISNYEIIDNIKDFEKFFDRALEIGCEGIIAKSPDSKYMAGARGWNWIKYKREYKSELVDTVDLVAVGAFSGRGRRAGTYGALLMAAYNPDKDCFETVCKLGTGFDDDTLMRLPAKFEEYRLKEIDKSVESRIDADYWFVPSVVMEILGAEITLSPIHTCGLGSIKDDFGLAIRFPRFTGRWRDDKNPFDATTTPEIIEMYKLQLKRFK